MPDTGAGCRHSGSEPAARPAGDWRIELNIADGPAAVREGRHFVQRQVAACGATALVDDAALVAGELLANAVQHGSPPVSVSVSGDAARVRITVHDASSRPPVRPAASTTNMTGRGLALVEAVAARWGFDRDPDTGGKTVWAELEPAMMPHDDEDVDVDALLAAWGSDDDITSERRFNVVLGDVPTDLLIAAKAHIDNLVREFTLAAGAGGEDAVPEHLAALIESVVHDFADARDAIKRQALAALRRGDERTRLSLHLAATSADAGERYLRALDEADAYARAARLLTLETPAPHRIFRRWYVEAVVAQLRQLTAGGEPPPVQPFESRLIDEVARLAALQRSSDRLARLQQVTAALARARTPEDVAAVVVSEGVEVLGATGGSLLLPADDGEHLTVPGAVGYEDELVDALREERLDAPLPAATALRTGEAIWIESQHDRDEQFPALQGFEAATIAMCAVPLVVAGRTLGALRFSFATRRLFGDDERAFVLALAAQTAQTLQRTELYAAEREASLRLQRALLPGDVPVVDGFDIATYYSPAGDGEAGGDFYDVMRLSDGRCVAVVGDVMGRGVAAAASMAQVRTMIRSYAVDDPAPSVVLQKVDAFFTEFELSQLVTVLYCLIRPESGVVDIGNAGHLPPLLVDAHGSRIVPTIVGPPLGVDPTAREAATVTVAEGSALVVITDGLVERRGEDIDHGVQRVLQATGNSSLTSARALLRRAVTASGPTADHDDDVTVLVLHRV
jgi:serine phosphatase RsbU (regulator of sigma subunit)/anti-sigma regulatory factor (Ser/Thr protein kinase)